MNFEVWSTSGRATVGYGVHRTDAALNALLNAREAGRMHIAQLRPGEEYEVRPEGVGERLWIEVDHDGEHAVLYKDCRAQGRIALLCLPPMNDESLPAAGNFDGAWLVARALQSDDQVCQIGLYAVLRHIPSTPSLNEVAFGLIRGELVSVPF